MAESIELSKLRKTLECGICLNVICQPKALICNHSFCKRCLDKILKFSPNGSASIKCPNGCKTETILSPTQTTNDLEINFMLKSVLDLLKVGENQAEPRTEGKCSSCSRCATKYCTDCRLFKCEECTDVHDDPEKKKFPESFVPVNFGFSSDNDSVTIVCRDHGTEVEHICCGNRFICPYCVHRGIHSKHKHRYQHLAQVEKSLKSVMVQKMDANADFEKRLDEAKGQISAAEISLDKELASRKIKCLLDYKASLDKEEEKVKREFHKVSQNYLSALNSISYFKKLIPKQGFSFLLERNQAVKMIDTMCVDDNERIPGTSVSLIDKKQMDGTCPLGSLTTVHCSDESCRMFRGKFCSSEHAAPPSSSVRAFIDILQDFVAKNNDRGQNLSCEVVVHSDEVDEVEEYEEVQDHQCELEKIVMFGAKKVRKTMHCTFEIQNVSKVRDGIVYSDPVMMKYNVLWKAAFSRSQTESAGEKTKYASVYLVCDYKGEEEAWSCRADVTITLKKRNATGLTKNFSHTFKNNADGWGYPDFISWADILNPDNGFLINDAITIETTVESDILEEVLG